MAAAMERPTVAAAVTAASRRLAPICDAPRIEAEFLLGAVCGLTRAHILAFPERTLDHRQAEQFEAAVARRETGEPAAYISGSREFHALELTITPAVLVPRPETEILVDLCAEVAGERACNVIDLGTGSGAIALAVKHALPRAGVTAVDSDISAIDVARRNAATLQLAVEVLQSNWFEAVAGRRFDIVVSNPPYVRTDDPHLAGPLRHEPRAALDGGKDGLSCYRAILETADGHLAAGGSIIFEHGFDQRDALSVLAGSFGFAVTALRDDLAELPRAMVLRRASGG